MIVSTDPLASSCGCSPPVNAVDPGKVCALNAPSASNAPENVNTCCTRRQTSLSFSRTQCFSSSSLRSVCTVTLLLSVIAAPLVAGAFITAMPAMAEPALPGKHVSVTYSLEVKRNGKLVKAASDQLQAGDNVRVRLRSNLAAYVMILSCRATEFNPGGRPLFDTQYEQCKTGSNSFMNRGKEYVSPEIKVNGPSRFKILLTSDKPVRSPQDMMNAMPTAMPAGVRSLDLEAGLTVEGDDTGSGIMFDAKL